MDRRGCGEELGGVEGREDVIRMYHMIKTIFNKRKYKINKHYKLSYPHRD